MTSPLMETKSKKDEIKPSSLVIQTNSRKVKVPLNYYLKCILRPSPPFIHFISLINFEANKPSLNVVTS